MYNIPKILHLYWDRSPMSRLQVFTIETFRNLNPDWKINVYIPKQKYIGDQEYVPEYTGIDCFNLVTDMYLVNIIEFDLIDYGIREDLHNILRSDIFRYHILYNQGGVWSDFDVIWLKPISYIDNIGTMVVFSEDTKGWHNISVMYSSPKHPFYENLINETIRLQNLQLEVYDHQAFGTEMLNVLYPDLESITNNFLDVVGLKYSTFYPYGIFELDKLYDQVDLTPLYSNNVMCIHWFNGHQLSKDYVNQNKFGDESSMTKILQQLGYVNV